MFNPYSNRRWLTTLLLLAMTPTVSVQAVTSGCAKLADAREAGLPVPPAGLIFSDRFQ